jgi:hypothetical protein
MSPAGIRFVIQFIEAISTGRSSALLHSSQQPPQLLIEPIEIRLVVVKVD